MDKATIGAYDEHAAAYAADWLGQPADVELEQLVGQYFRSGPTADIGCGAGRDTAWLAGQGYPVTGYDASRGLLAEARSRYPAIDFRQGTLPDLNGIGDGSFANVLCETVIMHLGPGEREQAVARLLAILQPGGTLYLSWRVTPGSDRRDERGRLYARFPAAEILSAMAGAQILHDAESDSAASGKLVRRIIARTAPLPG